MGDCPGTHEGVSECESASKVDPHLAKIGMTLKERVLIYQIGSLGDTVISIPALRAIRRHFGSRVHITLMHQDRRNNTLSPAEVLDGLGLVNEFISYRVIKNEIKEILYMMELIIRLRKKRFRYIFYLAPSERKVTSVIRDAAFFKLIGIKNHIGLFAFPDQMLHPVNDDGLPAAVQHEALLRLERLRRGGIDVSIESDLAKPFLSIPEKYVSEARRWLASSRQKPSLPLLAICPGCKQPANAWPIDRFIEIGHRLVQQGSMEILVVGGTGEREIANEIVKIWGSGLNAAGLFSPLGSAALLAECAFLVGLDTGTTHLAAAQGVPCVAIYGCREEPGRFYPMGEKHIVFRNAVSCAGCRLIEKPCPIASHPCMTLITVDSVWEAIQKMQLSLCNI